MIWRTGEITAPIQYSRKALLNFKDHRCVETVNSLAPNLPNDLKRRQRGKRGGKRNKLSNHRKIPLPALVIGNAQSINNKTDELASLISQHHAYKNASAIGITETWLNDNTDDSSLSFENFEVFRSDRDGEITGKTKGGGCMWLVNREWCTNTTIHRKYCSPDLEVLHLECRPHYLPREINIVNLILAYCVPEADEGNCTDFLENIVDNCLYKHPNSATIVAGDFNHVHLKHLPQYVDFHTRGNKTLDHCYSNIHNAYKAYKLPGIGLSDHCAIQLVPTYITNHKKCKRKKITKELLDEACIDKCQAAFETTDWDTLISDDIDDTITTISDYISYTISTNSTTIEKWVSNNNQPWLTKEIKEEIKNRYKAKNDTDRSKVKQTQREIDQLIKEAKHSYKNRKLDGMCKNMKEAWRGIKSMSNLNKNIPDIDTTVPKNDLPKLANDLNSFYLRFEKSEPPYQPAADDDSTQPAVPAFTVSEVNAVLRRCIPGKASGPDAIPTKILKTCANQLADVLCLLFNRCLTAGYIPQQWRRSEVVPVPKKPKPKALNDYRPIALTSVIMKSFEHLIKDRLCTFLKLDDNQFAYRKSRSTKDACLAFDFSVRKHLDKSKTYARALFIDFSSAFNTLSPNLLADKLMAMQIPTPYVKLILSFLKDRQQHVRISSHKSDILSSSIGCPQGCVLSPLLFSIYTDSVRSNHPSLRLYKYADDMVFLGLLDHDGNDDFYFNAISDFHDWCKANCLLLNIDKTKEMVFDFSRSRSITSDVFIDGKPIEKVQCFKYLGTIFSENLKWHENSEYIFRKLKSRFFAHSKFKSFYPSIAQSVHFVQTLILPILLYNSEIWFNSCTVNERNMLMAPFSKTYDCDISELISDRIFSTAVDFYRDEEHIFNEHYVPGRRNFLSMKCRTTRFLNSFIPFSIRLLNSNAFLQST